MSEFQKLQDSNANARAIAGGRCKLCGSVLKLEKSKIKDLYEALLDRQIKNTTIVEVLAGWGVSTSVSTVSLHRTGGHGNAEHMTNIKKAAGL